MGKPLGQLRLIGMPRFVVPTINGPGSKNVAPNDVVHAGVSRALPQKLTCRYQDLRQMSVRSIGGWPKGRNPVFDRAFGGDADEVSGVVDPPCACKAFASSKWRAAALS